MTVKITDTTMRDGHQSLLATRMRTEDMLPISPDATIHAATRSLSHRPPIIRSGG
jgi:pyruvate/oxaloacetate carboxyltransferase